MDHALSFLIVRPSQKNSREWVMIVQSLLQVANSTIRISGIIDPDPVEDLLLITDFEQIPLSRTFGDLPPRHITHVITYEEDRIPVGIPDNLPTIPFELVCLLILQIQYKFSLIAVITRLQTFIQTITRPGSSDQTFAQMIVQAVRNFLNAREVYYLKSSDMSGLLKIEAHNPDQETQATGKILQFPETFFQDSSGQNQPTSLKETASLSEELQKVVGLSPFYFFPVDSHQLVPSHFLLVIPDRAAQGNPHSKSELQNAVELCYPLLGTSFSLHKNHLALKKRAEFDLMTGAYNRASIEHILSLEIEQSKLLENKLSVMMVDIDHFKKINDSLGHHAGDEVLVQLAKSISGILRSEDRIGRYGGEEFLIILPRTGLREAKVIANRILTTVQEIRLSKYAEVRITVSIGIASYPDDAQHLVGLTSIADQMLYSSKFAGRNRYTSPDELPQSITPDSLIGSE